MSKNKNATLAVMALNAVITTTGLIAEVPKAIVQADSKGEVANLNINSLKAIESSWLALPITCKAKGFNAEPVSIRANPRSEALAVFQAFDLASV